MAAADARGWSARHVSFGSSRPLPLRTSLRRALWAAVDVVETMQYTSAPVSYAAAPSSETFTSTGHAREAAVPFQRTCAEVGHRDDKASTGRVDDDANRVVDGCRQALAGALPYYSRVSRSQF